jgi:hypothetical protein
MHYYFLSRLYAHDKRLHYSFDIGQHAGCVDVYVVSSIYVFLQVGIPLPLLPGSGEVVAEPLGVVLVFSTWNFPLGKSSSVLDLPG